MYGSLGRIGISQPHLITEEAYYFCHKPDLRVQHLDEQSEAYEICSHRRRQLHPCMPEKREPVYGVPLHHVLHYPGTVELIMRIH